MDGHSRTAVHVTAQAVHTFGGIGAVLEGLLTTEAYQEVIGRTVLVAPLLSREVSSCGRLGPGGEVLYSSLDGPVGGADFTAFERVETLYHVNIVYGRKTLTSRDGSRTLSPEVLLIDVTGAEGGPVNLLKGKLFAEFGIQSDQYEGLWEYEQYLRLAPAALAALRVLGIDGENGASCIISHDFAGMPTVLAARLERGSDFRTVFYAHETATVRRIVESRGGHDTMFYNVMRNAKENGLHLPEVFGEQVSYFKHAMIEASRHCDMILAVGDRVRDEMLFLGPEFGMCQIEQVYNGVETGETDLEGKFASREKLRQYGENLLGFRPDYVFTHVARMSVSKGLWRDLRVLEHLDEQFAGRGQTGILFILSTETGPRRSRDVYGMESLYRWPVAHREGYPDLSDGEAGFYTAVQEFNAKSRAIKTVFVNQFGFGRIHCGGRVPRDMEMIDLRRGTDVEFGQSVYEPFGISVLEPLGYGALCVVSSVSGCAGLVSRMADLSILDNIIVADYTALGDHHWEDLEDLLTIGREERNEIEVSVSGQVAHVLGQRLARNEEQFAKYLEKGSQAARGIVWEATAREFIAPALEKVLSRQRPIKVYQVM